MLYVNIDYHWQSHTLLTIYVTTNYDICQESFTVKDGHARDDCFEKPRSLDVKNIITHY